MPAKGKILIILIASLCLSSLFWVSKTSAQTYQYLPSISRLEAQVDLDADGWANIKQTIVYDQSSPLDWTIRVPSWRHLEIISDGKKLSRFNYHIRKKGHFRQIKSTQKVRAQNWQINYQTIKNTHLIRHGEQFRWEVFSQLNTQVQNVQITLNSPFKIESKDNNTPYRVYAFHGVGYYQAYQSNPKTVVFTGDYFSPEAGFTITTTWPKGTFHFSIIRELLLNISTFELTFWIIFGFILPILTFIFLLFIYRRNLERLHFEPPKTILDKPPNDLPSLMVGILFEKKIYAFTLVSAILDLCERGYLIIIKEDKQYILGKRKLPDEHLRTWEKELLEEIFANERVWTKQEDVEVRSHKQLFSKKIINIYEAAYNAVTELGYFSENPHLTRIKYKLFGIVLYLFTIIGIAWVGISFQPPFLLIPLGGVFLATLVIIRIAPHMPMQSEQGIQAMEQWGSFRNFLTQKQPLGAQHSVGGLFYEYLSFAIALRVETLWMQRFRNYRLIMPEWYVSSDRVGAEQAIPETMAIIKHLSHSLSQLRGPAVT